MFAEAQIVKRGNNYHVQHGTDAGLYVQFYMEAIFDEEDSKAQGRPIYKDREFIRIIPVGDKNTIVCEPVTDDHRMRWPQQYAAFKNQHVQAQDGTPIDQWPPLTKSQVMMFKSANVHTVEQLANVSDSNLTNLGMGSRDLREKAIAYLKNAESGAGVMALQDQLNDALKQIEALKNQLAGFKPESEDKKRGRPNNKKEVIDDENAA